MNRFTYHGLMYKYCTSWVPLGGETPYKRFAADYRLDRVRFPNSRPKQHTWFSSSEKERQQFNAGGPGFKSLEDHHHAPVAQR